jgi:hypothetical protein
LTPWLPLLGGQFTEEHGLEPADLPHLTDADLSAAGLDKPLHRKRVYRHAREECGPGLWHTTSELGVQGPPAPPSTFAVMGLFWLAYAPMDISHRGGGDPRGRVLSPAG